MSRNYGTCPDVPDHRDHYWEATRMRVPKHFDLRADCPPVYNQGPLNSCSANALAAAMWFQARKTRGQIGGPSRLFIYYNERSAERHPRCNVPVSLRNGHKTLAKHGSCLEEHWRYSFGKFSVRPPKHCYADARDRRVSHYARLRRDLKVMKACLVSGFPFTMGISVYESFETPAVRKTGQVPMPKKGERLKGGHAVMVAGYDDAKRSLIVRNSWGPRWGMQGYCLLPYDFVLNKHYAWDFWTILELTDV